MIETPSTSGQSHRRTSSGKPHLTWLLTREAHAKVTWLTQRCILTAMAETCGHIEAITSIKYPLRRECAECVKIGAEWLHLRTCQTCGGTHCCDDSPNRHATKHAKSSGHPVIASAEIGERWLYCYPDDSFAEY